MKYGFTGTQQGLTPLQLAALRKFMEKHPMDEFHHGSCIGADYEAHQLALTRCRVFVHPSKVKAKTIPCVGHVNYEPLLPLTRNRMIVQSVDRLLACPKSEDEELRSGTWMTVRHARKVGVQVVFFYPSGRVCVELAPPTTHEASNDFDG